MSDFLDHYDYDLPKDLIAQFPLPQRMDARLLVVDRSRGSWEHRHIRDLPKILLPSDCLVMNNTRVVPARLTGKRTETGGHWEGLFLREDGHGNWLLIGKTRGKLKSGETITLQDRDGRDGIQLQMIDRGDDGTWIARPLPDADADADAAQKSAADPVANSVNETVNDSGGDERTVSDATDDLLQRYGAVPLPHYIRGGKNVASDVERYQTVFAKHAGAVAAPTAGLHFTDNLLKQIRDQGTTTAEVTLHVGIGTFRPIAVDRLSDHKMHSEWGEIDETTATQLRQTRENEGRVIAIGTTSVRVLESAAADGNIAAWQGETDLFIRPGYRFQAIDGLLTNFHLPKSTLLVLVRTLGGDELIRDAYESAIASEYRFYSYGDAMLII